MKDLWHLLTQQHGKILEFVIANAPVNALGSEDRCALKATILRVQHDDTVAAVVIRGEGMLFSGGADIREFGQAPTDPVLPGGCISCEWRLVRISI